MEMSEKSIIEYTTRMRERYARMTGRRARGVMLDEYTEVTGFERKHANRVLLGIKRKNGRVGKRGAPKRYGQEVLQALKVCWFAMEQPCGKRMRDMLPLWVNYLEVGEETRARLLSISPASIDRLLRPLKVESKKRIRPPRSDSAIKSLVEIRAESWDTREPGWTEVDTVAHCGGDMGGDFIWTTTSVDIASGWTEVRPIWNRGQYATCEALDLIARAQPFDLKGIDSDNGGEFLNYHLYTWLKERGIKQTRSRPYYKNDQAYVEQKNYTHVRQLLGYDRLEYPELIGPLNELLGCWCLWRNLFCVTMEQIEKKREGSRQIRRHASKSRTPAQRLLDGGGLNTKQRKWLEKGQKNHNPFELKKCIEAAERVLWKKRDQLNKEQAEEKDHETLAPLGPSPLRSDGPKGAKQKTKRTPKQKIAMVS